MTERTTAWLSALVRLITVCALDDVHFHFKNQRVSLIFAAQTVRVVAWKFTFGYVIPMSVNSWEQTIVAAGQMIPPEVLSGNTKIETSFYDDKLLVSKNVIRLFYVWSKLASGGMTV